MPLIQMGILIAIWLYLLSVCKRGNLAFYHFIIGSVGLFVICMSQVGRFQSHIIAMFVRILSPIASISGIFECYPEIGAFFINHNDTVMSLYIDLECSGIIEMLVFVSLLLFFDLYSKKEKCIISMVGVCFIILFNAIRMVSILAIIYFGGAQYYLLAHSVLGRLIFYVLTIILYYVVFTKGQIDRQKVGAFAYESGVFDE